MNDDSKLDYSDAYPQPREAGTSKKSHALIAELMRATACIVCGTKFDRAVGIIKELEGRITELETRLADSENMVTNLQRIDNERALETMRLKKEHAEPKKSR